VAARVEAAATRTALLPPVASVCGLAERLVAVAGGHAPNRDAIRPGDALIVPAVWWRPAPAADRAWVMRAAAAIGVTVELGEVDAVTVARRS
jgi:hypothetical protein